MHELVKLKICLRVYNGERSHASVVPAAFKNGLVKVESNQVYSSNSLS